MSLVITSIELGLLFGLLALGVFLTFRILHFPDLTVDGSFVAGAAITAITIKAGFPATVALLFGFGSGLLAGLLTAFLHVRLGIGKILAGILSLGILYTVNLRIMDGPNISLLNEEGVFAWLKIPTNHIVVIGILLMITFGCKFILDWFLKTEFGLLLRATGENESTAKGFGVNIGFVKMVGVALSNGLVALSGGLVAQYQGFVDVNMGVGMIILGLAALMLGEALFSKPSVPVLTCLAILGAVSYQLIVNIALRLGLAPTDLKLITSLIVILSLVAGNSRRLSLWSKNF